MKIQNIQDVQKIFSNFGERVFGLNVSPFMSIAPTYFLPNFEIISYKDSIDVDYLSNLCPIHNVQKYEIMTKISSFKILNTNFVKENVIKKNQNFCVLVNKSVSSLEKMSKKYNFKILNNKWRIRRQFENKKTFREILEKIWITPITWKNVSFDFFISKDLNYRQGLYGKKIVLQFPDMEWWGGKSTFFVNNSQDLEDIKNKFGTWIYKDFILQSINVTKFVSWVESSIIWCVTKFGVITSTIQTQVLDIPEVLNTDKWCWLFCWHDRSYMDFGSDLNKQARDIAIKIWNYMKSIWYRWIFGLDLICDMKNQKVHIIECNSRFTGAMPSLSMIDYCNYVIPLDVFHILEFADLKYEIDIEYINQMHNYHRNGSHIILSNRYDEEIVCQKELKSGVYKFEKNNLTWLRDGFDYSHILSDDEFIITDGNPRIWHKVKKYDEYSRVCRLLFPNSILESPKNLKEKPRQIINKIYEELFSI